MFCGHYDLDEGDGLELTEYVWTRNRVDTRLKVYAPGCQITGVDGITYSDFSL